MQKRKICVIGNFLKLGEERNQLPTVTLFNTIITYEKLFIILKASFPIILNLLVSRK